MSTVPRKYQAYQGGGSARAGGRVLSCRADGEVILMDSENVGLEQPWSLASLYHSLLAASEALARGGPHEIVLRHLARAVQQVSTAETVGVYWLKPSARALFPIAGFNVPRRIRKTVRDAPLSLSRWPALAATLKTREPLSSVDRSWHAGTDEKFLGQVPRHTALIVPIVLRGESVGIFYLAWWSANCGVPLLSPSLRMLTTQAGAAVQTLAVGRETSRTLPHTEILLAASRALSSTLDLQSLLRHILRWMSRSLEAHPVGTYVLEPDGEWLRPLQGYRLPPQYLEALRRLKISVKTSPIYAEGVARRQMMFVSDVDKGREIPIPLRTVFPHRAHLFVPLVGPSGVVVGALIAVWMSRVPRLRAADLALVDSIAAQAGAMVDNARLVEENRSQLRQLLSLTRRQSEIITMIDAGLANKEIAVRLGIETQTVKNHVHIILEKCQLQNRHELARLAKAARLI